MCCAALPAVLLCAGCCDSDTDPLYARENVWIPFMKQDLGCGPDTIIVVRKTNID
jgi:hypothetical protein